jgi:hypothetical protein
MRRSRLLGGLGLILTTSIVVACNGAGAGATTPVSTTSTTAGTGASMAPESQTAAGTPAPSNMLVMNIALLPTPSIDTSKIAVACDQATLGTSAAMSCDDLTALTARIAATTSNQPVQQISVTKPDVLGRVRLGQRPRRVHLGDRPDGQDVLIPGRGHGGRLPDRELTVTEFADSLRRSTRTGATMSVAR